MADATNPQYLSYAVKAPQLEPASPDPAEVLTEALLRASDLLGLKKRELSRVLGVSEASVSRLGRSRTLNLEAKETELGALFLRAFRSLDALVGGSEPKARAWLRADNHHLGGVPAELCQRAEGLVSVVHYLDAMRGTH
ncbi:MAG: DUF2384 domain-containing protein [Deltaproteobacteria bacterium]|nr:DUF2384 domain-containing protein [Deltaproteobacteria bacterium]